MTKQSQIIDDPLYAPVHDHGFVGLVDTMGSDSAIVQAARVSYGAGTKMVNSDRGLIRYLLRHRHTTPFEMCEVKLHVRAPILAIRQWFRHRTASVNEESARYSEVSDELYMPSVSVIQPQSKDNKQGRAGTLSADDAACVSELIATSYENALSTYRVLVGEKDRDKIPNLSVLDSAYDVKHFVDEDHNDARCLSGDFPGIARELARTVMPVGSYSEFYWKANLWNVFNFLRLRAEMSAQYEIRAYADEIITLLRPVFPLAFEAFDDYILGAITLSRMECDLTVSLLRTASPNLALMDRIKRAGGVKAYAASVGLTERELKEFAQNFNLDLSEASTSA